MRNFIPAKRKSNEPAIRNLLWAGRAIPEKNLETLNRVGERVAKRHPEFRLDLITNKSHNDVLEMIKNSYAMISIAYTDISPNFIIEGISFNKPFILTKETGLSELFPTGGIFVDPHKDEEIENAIESMLDSRVYNSHKEELKGANTVHLWRDLANEFLEIWRKV